jgi:hypothetical protein
VGGGITIQLPNGSQIQIPQGSVVRTADGTLLISGGSQEGVSSPLPLHVRLSPRPHSLAAVLCVRVCVRVINSMPAAESPTNYSSMC